MTEGDTIESLWRIVMLLAVLVAFLSSAFAQAPDNDTHARQFNSGKLVGVTADSISIRSHNRNFVFRVNSDTKMWRGGTVTVHQLHLGEDVDVIYLKAPRSAEPVAIEVNANIVNWSGKIINVNGQRVEIAREDERGNSNGRAEILLDKQTVFVQGTRKNILMGGSMQSIGLNLGHDQMRATKVLAIIPPSANH